jgi:hypothetical protein
VDPEARIAQVMLDLGSEQFVPSVEEVADSVWLDDDRVEAPGYYVRRRVALGHTILRDSRVFILEFERDHVTYRIRSSSRDSLTANGHRVVELIETLHAWVDEKLLTWEEAFRPFVHAAWWIVLRVLPDATPAEIEAAYKRHALVCHPDRGGSDAAFQKLHAAYQHAWAATS